MERKYKQFETRVIHTGYDSKEHLGSLSAPIYQTSTFTFETAEQGERFFAGEEKGYIYSRLGNPTVSVLQEKMAELEEGEACLAFGSGMAAISAVLLSLTKTNDHVLVSQGVYGCTYGLLKLMEEKYNITHDFCFMETSEQIRSLIKPETTCIYIETPINPTMKMIDIEMVTNIAREYSIPVVVDNTFCSPYLQKPLQLGCDVVVHSATKYICGHGDVVAGLAIGSQELMSKIAMTTQKDIGGILAPFDAWLLIRGLKTLPIRMDRHCENTMKLVEWMKKHPAIKDVYYPGDTSHPDYEIMKKQMKYGGGLFSFEINGSKQDVQNFLNHLKMIKIAVSLGDAETLVQHPATMTHSVIPEDVRLSMGITDQLIRLSVGLESWEDIRDDLQQGLDHLTID
ncbi:methionine gamma-lyase [Anaerobacillus alkaliphilus]|uniref:L-methionine gamma-lyase n=1 Tax=Anaerobacillus alkaliphilus TaxID=1548597 RepID=A0A4Q0VNC0_9BACI|nr:methionine gamma-lyase [Anaerobacillus alkaliphilus]RXI97902.1 methionine gamma-lyase [Anaerobacillus alkaliphilus]